MDFCHFLIFLLFAHFVAQTLAGLQGLPMLRIGDSLAVEKENDFLVSANGTFSSGFYKVGTNAYCFAIWFTNSSNKTVVWMANRDMPVNGKRSRLTLHANGNLFLTDADGSNVWSTNTFSASGVQVQLLETGNLALIDQAGGFIWESFHFPTDTLLPSQLLTKNTTLVSVRSQGSYSSGFYNFKFSDNNVLYLVYNGPVSSSAYWPDTNAIVFDYGRTPYNSTREAVLTEFGEFKSSDNLVFNASDYGIGPKRRLTLDYDGMLRLYSLDESTGLWELSWLPAGLLACQAHGSCGEYGVCSYRPRPICTCPKGFNRSDPSDWSKGCSPSFNMTCNQTDLDFVVLHNADYYGYDLETYAFNVSFEACRNSCLSDCRCMGFGYSLDGQRQCYPKSKLLNGYQTPSKLSIMHIKVSKQILNFLAEEEELKASGLKCQAAEVVLNSTGQGEEKSSNNQYMKYLIAFVGSFAVIEIACVGLGWWFVFRKRVREELINMGYSILDLGFKRFTYAELKRATNNFKQEIGRGGFGTVFKGILTNGRIVAVKRLEGITQGELEFWAEVSIIGRINHRNLVKLWGFCAEKKNKLLVYEYMDNGSLDQILFTDASRTLELDQRYNIAVGTAKGLSYLHEECLEWVLHCDVKPQNILLDEHFEPKVADFGMSKLFKDKNDFRFSRVRGTRGYLAPEWMMNLKINAKADVYSYGIVLLELLSGKSASSFQLATAEENEGNHEVEWAVKKINEEGFKEVIDPRLNIEHNEKKIERLVQVALLCVEEDRDKRPAMSKVVELLIGCECDESSPDREIGS